MTQRTLQTLLIVLVAALAPAALCPAPTSARCAPAQGWQLQPVRPTATAGSTALFQLVPVMRASDAMPLPIGTVAITAARCTANCTTTVTARALAANLFAIDLPVALAPGEYALGGHARFTVATGSAAATTPGSTPAIAATAFGQTRIGTGTLAPTLELAAAPPADAVGTLIGWGTTSWFVPSGAGTRLMLIRPRCSPVIPGRGALAVGDRLTVRFVGPTGLTSPAASVSSTIAIGADGP